MSLPILTGDIPL